MSDRAVTFGAMKPAQFAAAFSILAALSIFFSCAGTDDHPPGRPLGIQADEAAADFFQALASEGTAAQACYTLFLPEGNVNKRYILRFREAVENALRKASYRGNMQFNATADRVFFLSEHRPADWKTPEGGDNPAHVLARELKNGTPAGWTALHSFWAQANRLLIGDAAWIQGLPDSIRADLSHPLTYVLRATVALESNPDVVTYVHRLTFELAAVGTERTIFVRTYPLVLSYPLP